MNFLVFVVFNVLGCGEETVVVPPLEKCKIQCDANRAALEDEIQHRKEESMAALKEYKRCRKEEIRDPNKQSNSSLPETVAEAKRRATEMSLLSKCSKPSKPYERPLSPEKPRENWKECLADCTLRYE